jgi:putative phosphoesterase
MLLGIISDTHDRPAAAEQALRQLHARGVRQIIHCGDWTTAVTIEQFIIAASRLDMTVMGVLGNNDRQTGEIFQMLARLSYGQHIVEGVLEIRIAGKFYAAYHGHHKPTLTRVLDETDYDAVFLGHSHKPRDEQLPNGLHIVNPGSTAFAIPRRRDWQASVAMYDTVTDTAEHLYFEVVK